MKSEIELKILNDYYVNHLKPPKLATKYNMSETDVFNILYKDWLDNGAL